ncbi:sensor histidine kinase [Photobacterium sanctipauli]|uniref:histidine kinase n=1 Tax=Photobacterium sanctipauli TaxID=1342794 RepID=A0A2T3P0I5_9GAMM|nr:HAMP domain-containing sensor histidine kinase [Photobacterium sanctipauli]PSW21992.1 sensor histidine kinase [Photobacterium sanctipauli]
MNFKHRLLLLTGFWFLLSALLLGGLFVYQQQLVEQRTQQALHKELAAHMRDDSPLMQGTDFNPAALKSLFHTLMLLGPDFEIYFLDQQGTIRTHAAPEGKVLLGSVSLSPIQQFLDNQPFPILGDDPRNPSVKKVFSVAPITEFGSVIGYLYVVIGSEQRALLAEQEQLTTLFYLIGVSLLLVIGFSYLTYRLVKRTLLKPIEHVTGDLQDQAGNDFRLKPEFVNQVPELKPVAKQLYLMAQQIQQQFLQLQQEEARRRELLMQLSHDLKTPLSSILGYLETWKIQNKEPNALIDTAHRNAEKLSEQLSEQLALARNQQQAPQPKFEQIALYEVIEEIQESLAPEANKKALSLAVSIPEQEVVFGDRQLLLRLFANLFENAIRHAPSNSRIALEVIHQHPNLTIKLCNDIDPSAPSGSMGLGTKIIQSILMLHHSQLITKQEENHFLQQFHLPASSG